MRATETMAVRAVRVAKVCAIRPGNDETEGKDGHVHAALDEDVADGQEGGGGGEEDQEEEEAKAGEGPLLTLVPGDGGEDEPTEEAETGSVIEEGAGDGHIVIEVLLEGEDTEADVDPEGANLSEQIVDGSEVSKAEAGGEGVL